MFCPECVVKSNVYPLETIIKTVIGQNGAEFYDKEGKHHYHRGYVDTRKYKCDNGHVWLDTKIPATSCRCGWPKDTRYELKFDLNPQVEGVQQADARNLLLEDNSLGSIMFDPPFLDKPGEYTGKMNQRFGAYPTIKALWEFYTQALTEFWRVLKPEGIIAFKCQDTVSGRKNHFSHVKIYNIAVEIGYYPKDLLVLGRQSVMWSANMANQMHARKNHCYFWVFKRA